MRAPPRCSSRGATRLFSIDPTAGRCNAWEVTVADNLIDYARWRGDLDFAERPFNDVDALVLATLSYIDLVGIVPNEAAGGTVGVGAALGELLELSGGDVTPYVRSLATIDAGYLKAVAESRRFGRLRIGRYVDVMDHDRAVQFAAVEVLLPPGSVMGCEGGIRYVSFRGTDLTLAGWREDFMLSFEVTGAQRLAANYLSRALEASATAGEPLMAGGHSKGGNLVSYAVAAMPKALADHLLRCYSFDGPGLDGRVVERDARDAIGDRFVRYQPAYSVIGQLFDRADEPRTYVASTGSGMLQHDPLTWRVLPSGFVLAGGLDPDAAAFDAALDEWMGPVDMGERERFTNEFFDILSAGGPELTDVTSREGLPKVMTAANGASDQTKRLVWKLVECVVAKQAERTSDVVRRAYEGVVQSARNAASGLAVSLPRRQSHAE